MLYHLKTSGCCGGKASRYQWMFVQDTEGEDFEEMVDNMNCVIKPLYSKPQIRKIEGSDKLEIIYFG